MLFDNIFDVINVLKVLFQVFDHFEVQMHKFRFQNFLVSFFSSPRERTYVNFLEC